MMPPQRSLHPDGRCAMTAGVIGLDCPGAVQFVPQGSDVCRDLLALYAEEIPGKLAQEFDALEKTGSADAARELRGRMEEPIAQLCARSLKGLES